MPIRSPSTPFRSLGALIPTVLALGLHAEARAEIRADRDAVYIVTSAAQYQKQSGLLAEPVARRMRVGSEAELVVSRVRGADLPALTQNIHSTEHRCGGYFAFQTRAEAEAFLRDNRSDAAMTGRFLPEYSVDNQATVTPWLAQVSETKLRATLSALSTNWPNRYYTTSHGRSAAHWIREQWQTLAAGRSDVRTELHTECSNCGGQPSVLLTIPGSELPSEIVVIGAHLDSINGAGGGESMAAPGADDDASGVATMTEVIRVALASGFKPKRTVQFMAYAAEEVGLRGSNAIAQSYQRQGKNVVGVLQLDMTNYRPASTGADVYIMTDNSNAALVAFLKKLFATYLQPSGLRLAETRCGYGCSDHASWTNAGFPAAMFAEADMSAMFPHLHTRNDTLAQMGGNASHSVHFAKLGLAFLGELGKSTRVDSPPPPPPPRRLSNGVPLPAQAAGAGSTLRYVLEVPAGAGALVIKTEGGTGDADLAVALGHEPTRTSSLCRSEGPSNKELCVVDAPAAGTYHLALSAYSAFSGVSVVASHGAGGGDGEPEDGVRHGENNTSMAIPDVDPLGISSPIRLSASGRLSRVVVDVQISHAYIGDLVVELLTPSGQALLLHNRAGGAATELNQRFELTPEPQAISGLWQLRVRDRATRDTGSLQRWSLRVE